MSIFLVDCELDQDRETAFVSYLLVPHEIVINRKCLWKHKAAQKKRTLQSQLFYGFF